MSKEKNTVNSSDSVVGISVRHYSNSFSGVEPPMVKDFGPSNTDKSTYRPDISLIPPFLASGGNSNKQFAYDFPDGKDTHDVSSYTVTYLRNKGLDITEVDSAIEREKSRLQSIVDSASSAKEKETARKALENLANLALDKIDSENDGNIQKEDGKVQE